jgi:hypothetical protein
MTTADPVALPASRPASPAIVARPALWRQLDRSALEPRLGEISDWVVGPGRAELAAAMGSPSVVMALLLGQDRP